MNGNKIWNGSLLGLVSVVYIYIQVLFERVADKITQILFLHNIKKCGKNCVVHRGLYYRYPYSIVLGKDVIIGRNNVFSSEHVKEFDSYLHIGDGVSIGSNCKIDFTGGVTIRPFAHIAHEVMISTHDHGYDYTSVPKGKRIVIGESAFIGNRVIILHNCNYIGKKAVIGTGSVVTKDVPDFAVVAGNPARIIKYLE